MGRTNPGPIQFDEDHIKDMNAWIDSLDKDCQSHPIPPIPSLIQWERDSFCDCGEKHSGRTFLNAKTGSFLCQECIDRHDRDKRTQKQQETEELYAEIEQLQNPVKMFEDYLMQKGIKP